MNRQAGRSVVAVLGLSLVLGAAGCGGDESVTQADFIRQADALCAKTRKATRAERESASDMSLVAFTNRVLKEQQQLVDDLEAVEPPEDLSARYDEYLATLRKQYDLTQQIVDEAEPDSDGTLETGSAAAGIAKTRDAATHKAVDLSKQIGFKDCTV